MTVSYPLATETWDEKEYQAIQRVIDSRMFTMGAEVKKFEEEFAAFFRSKYAVMCNSGSSANLLAIAAMIYAPQKFLKAGDVVLVPAVSWSTTYYPLHQHGLEMRFVDVCGLTLNIDLDLLEKAITPETKAILTVNLLGNPCDFDRLLDICDRYNLILIEDNCESMGATYDGKYAGTFGICGTFSTFFSHHISTMEGGLVITDDETIYHTLISLRAHGWTRGQPENSHLNLVEDPFTNLFRFVLPGYNLRPLEMEGAIGQEQLKKLPEIVRKRRENAEIFIKELSGLKNIRLQAETGQSSWFGFSLILEGTLRGRRSELVKAMQAEGIECRPIVTGNFLNNPVIAYLNHSIGSKILQAEEIDKNGLFVGNHHYPIAPQIAVARSVLEKFTLADSA